MLLAYGCETLSLVLKEERRPRVLENRILRKIFRPERDEIIGTGGDTVIRSLICTRYYAGDLTKQDIIWGGGGRWHELRRGEVHEEFWWGNLRGRNQLEGLGVDGMIILK
jgi:hypothetical protein